MSMCTNNVSGHSVGVTEIETYDLVRQYDIPVVRHTLVRSPEEAIQAGKALGWPVVCKVVSPDIIHKSRFGGVKVGLRNIEEVAAAFTQIVSDVELCAPQARIIGCLIAEQAPFGLAEVIIGALRDIEFGPSVMCGVGGEYAEILRYVVFRPAPLSRKCAYSMVEMIKHKMGGHHGWENVNPNPLAEVITRMGDLLINNKELDSIDLNPVIAYPEFCLVVDAKALKTLS